VTQPTKIQTVDFHNDLEVYLLTIPYNGGNLILMVEDQEAAGKLYEALCDADPSLLMFTTAPLADDPEPDKEAKPDESH
jgi:hypothetical protein